MLLWREVDADRVCNYSDAIWKGRRNWTIDSGRKTTGGLCIGMDRDNSLKEKNNKSPFQKGKKQEKKHSDIERS